jgi:ribonuclease D
MTTWPFPPAAYIDSDAELRALVTQLAQEPVLGIDTESNSLHAYKERVCLFQVSTRTTDYIIDPLTIADMQPLGALLADPNIEKIFHAAEYDLICIKRDFGFTVVNLFDTMVAARICGRKAVGLGALVAEYAGVEIDKSHQRDDWRRRPLPAASLHYAQMDTHYLPALRDQLYGELEASGHFDEAREIFAEICHIVPSNGRKFDPEGYWHIGLPHSLNRRQMAMLRELYLLREQLAERRDCPPFKVFSNTTLVQLAQAEPSHMKQLSTISGMSTMQIRRYGQQILRALERGRSNRLPHPPRQQPPDPVASDLYTALHTWRRTRAEQRGVDSDVIISKHTLWALARKAPKQPDDLQGIHGLGPWRLQAYGAEILNVIASFHDSK